MSSLQRKGSPPLHEYLEEDYTAFGYERTPSPLPSLTISTGSSTATSPAHQQQFRSPPRSILRGSPGSRSYNNLHSPSPSPPPPGVATQHRRGISWAPFDDESLERERDREAGRTAEISKAKAKASSAAAAAHAAANQAQQQTATSPSFFMSRQQKTAFHPLTTPSNSSHSGGSRILQPLQPMASAQHSHAYAIQHSTPTADGSVSIPLPSSSMSPSGSLSPPPAFDSPHPFRMQRSPSPSPEPSQQQYQYPIPTNAAASHSNAVPRLSVANMSTPQPPSSRAYPNYDQNYNSSNSPTPSSSSSPTSSSIRDNSMPYSRSSTQPMQLSSSIYNRPRSLDISRSPSASPPSSAPPSPSKMQRPLAMSWSRAPSASQSLRSNPLGFCRDYLIPHTFRVAKSRAKAYGLKIILGALALFFTLQLLTPDVFPSSFRLISSQSDNPSGKHGRDTSNKIFDILSNGDMTDFSTTDAPNDGTLPTFSPLQIPALRTCPPSSLDCRLQDVPVYPSTTGEARKRVLLIVVNEGFQQMALNLICSADMIGNGVESPASILSEWNDGGSIPRTSWLVACSDASSYDFFLARGIPAVRMNASSVLAPINPRERKMQKQPIGSSASSWGETTHININREKVPLIHSILQHGVDVMLIDADVVFLQPLTPLFDETSDLQVMHDFPSSTTADFTDGGLRSLCFSYPNQEPCKQVWEMNGGFFLLRATRGSIDLYADMITWLQSRPNDHDQDALREALKLRANKGRLQWSLEDGTKYPEKLQTTLSTVSFRFLNKIMAPNGGFYFTQGRAEYLELTSPNSAAAAAAKKQPFLTEPIAVHVNWVVGYERKVALMKQYSMWFVRHTRDNGAQCMNVLLSSRKSDTSLNQLLLQASAEGEQAQQQLVHPPPTPFRVHSTSTIRALSSPPYANTPSASLLFFTTPKPVSSFFSLPRFKEADQDGMGGYDPQAPENDYPENERQSYLQEQEVQFEAQMLALRNWFALTDRGSSNPHARAPVQTAIFSSDPAHGELAAKFRMDYVLQYDTDEYGIPKLQSLFQQAEAIAHKRAIPVVMYSNGDLLYHPSELARTAAAIQSYEFASFLAVGIRKNVESRMMKDNMNPFDRAELERIKEILLPKGKEGLKQSQQEKSETSSPEAGEWSEEDKDRILLERESVLMNVTSPLSISRSGSLAFFRRLAMMSRPYRTDALDFFMWKPGFFDWDVVPQFLVGRIAYDNWLLHYGNTKARSEANHGFGNIAVVDVSQTVEAIHINHGHGLKPVAVSKKTATTTSEEDSASNERIEKILGQNAEIRSHFQPNSMVNIRLGGQASVKGLGKLESVGWRTVKLERTQEIRVVKTRPESGHIADLYDVANECHTVINDRPTLIVVTVDNAHVPHFNNWLFHMRKALRQDPVDADSERSGILVLSAGPEATAAAKALGVSVFELAPGERNSAALSSNSPGANLQITGLKSRAVLLLIEFGYDVLVSSVSTIFKRNPWRVMSERAQVQGDQREVERRAMAQQRRNASQRTRARNHLIETQGIPSTSASAASRTDGLQLGVDMDLIAFAYDSSPFNVSSHCVFYRHTPVMLKTLHRVLHEIVALLQRAQLPFQISYQNLQLDWFLQHELHQNFVSSTRSKLVWSSVSLQAGVFTIDDPLAASVRSPSQYSKFPHLPAGAIQDADVVFANGFWFERPGGLGAMFAEGNRARLKEAGVWDEKSQSVNEEWNEAASIGDHCSQAEQGSALDCGKLSAEELEQVRSVATVDGSVLIVPISPAPSTVSSPLSSSNLNMFLARIVEVRMKHVILLAADAKSYETSVTDTVRNHPFVVMYGSGVDGNSDSSFVSKRMYQLLSNGFAVGVANVETSLLFGNPFEFYTNRLYETQVRDSKESNAVSSGAQIQSPHSAYFSSQSMWTSSLPHSSPAFVRPLSDLQCDVHSSIAASLPTASPSANKLLLHDSGSLTSWTFTSIQPGLQSRIWLSQTIQCFTSETARTVDGNLLPSACMQSSADRMQANGLLNVCDVDAYFFPSAQVFFDPPQPISVSPPAPLPSDAQPVNRLYSPSNALAASVWRHPAETGVNPLILPRKWENALNGRVMEWSADWREKSVRVRDVALPFPALLPPNQASAPSQIQCGKFTGGADRGSFTLLIRVLTFNRAASLYRLLESLKRADYFGDGNRIQLEISVDRIEGDADASEEELESAPDLTPELIRHLQNPPTNARPLSVQEQRTQVLSVLKQFEWINTQLEIKLQPKHLGLVGQWISTPASSNSRELVLVLEDDIEVSPLFYSWLKGAICAYSFDSRNYDPRLFGISLQRQHYVLGQSVKNSKYTFLRFKEEQAKQEAWEKLPQQSQATRPEIVTDMAALWDFDNLLGDATENPVFRYQLLGTWGLLIFPQHWNAFKTWYEEIQSKNNAARAAGSAASPDDANDMFEPCVPHLESSSWWSSKKDKVWSQWFIRYVFEQGWYGLYAHLPGKETIALNHREAGENYNVNRGARDAMLLETPTVPESLQPFLEPASGNKFAFPPLQKTPLFDFHLQRIQVDPIVLQQRRVLLTDKQMKRGCVLKDYKPFN